MQLTLKAIREAVEWMQEDNPQWGVTMESGGGCRHVIKTMGRRLALYCSDTHTLFIECATVKKALVLEYFLMRLKEIYWEEAR